MTTEPPEPTYRRIARWVLRLFFFPLGLALIALPFALIVLKEDYALVDDTRALFGAGISAEDDPAVPVVVDVSCTKKRVSFRSTDRAGSWLGWDCSVSPAPLAWRDVPKDDPFAGRSHDAGMVEWSRRNKLQLDALKLRSTMPSFDRSLATDRSSGDPAALPELRRLSPGNKASHGSGGKPPRYGLVWGAGELSLRWLAWLADALLFFIIGGPMAYAGWRLSRR